MDSLLGDAVCVDCYCYQSLGGLVITVLTSGNCLTQWEGLQDRCNPGIALLQDSSIINSRRIISQPRVSEVCLKTWPPKYEDN